MSTATATATARQRAWRDRKRQRQIVLPVQVKLDDLLELLMSDGWRHLLPEDFPSGDEMNDRASLQIALSAFIKNVLEN